jgi:hypothetical protein
MPVARYFYHREISSQRLLSGDEIRELAGKISALPAFARGTAVLCGSVAWGTHQPRSDIDIAFFGTVEHPSLEDDIKEIVAHYEERRQVRLLLPRIDIITIGIEPEVQAATTESHSITGEPKAPAGASVNGVFVMNHQFPTVFADTFVRFADHIGALAHLQAGPWKEFLTRYLSPPRDDRRSIQREAIRSYVATTTQLWNQQPLHPRLPPQWQRTNFEFSREQLDLLGQAENYPVNLMRRILGAMDLYPRPDRAADVRAQFEKLAQPWARSIVMDSAPFSQAALGYDAIIEGIRNGDELTAVAYNERVCALFDTLPFEAIEQAVLDYLNQAEGAGRPTGSKV